MSVHPEVLFTAAYAVFLLGMAGLLRWNGHRVQRQAHAASENDPSWSHWQAGHFRFGLSRVLLALAGYILCAAAYHYHTLPESSLLTVIGSLVVWHACRRSRRARATQIESAH